MELKVNLVDFDYSKVAKEIESAVEKLLVDKYAENLKSPEWIVYRIICNVTERVNHHFYMSEIQDKLVSAIINSMSDDEIKKIIVEALLLRRSR